ncbi:TrmH family RNA methyltransferase [Tistrella bauzanensis]|uniref:TrmH family RNA methyltransferase n=1 Tax=Tistrella arctica TaxID=3133430 RepID=A0ABU9YF23_9PROT
MMQIEDPDAGGCFAVGLDRSSKPFNAGTLNRLVAAHGGAYTFTAGADWQTSQHWRHWDDAVAAEAAAPRPTVPHLAFDSPAAARFPEGFTLVAVELTDDAVDLPAFRHPPRAVYVLGPERGMLAPEFLDRATHVVKIPMRFSLNVAMAASLVLFDRLRSRERAGAVQRLNRRRAEAAVQAFLDQNRALRAPPPPPYAD